MSSENDARRILIIEDDFDLASIIRVALETCGYDVSIATNGRRALALQRARPADIVVTDIFMPEMDGIETIEALQKEFPRIPIIVMSAGAKAGQVDYLRVARMLGAAKCLRKPFDLADLIAAVAGLGESHPGAAAHSPRGAVPPSQPAP